MTDKIIRGSGGPPPSPPSPTRAPDTLNSRQFATIQDLLSEGEIEGFATASKAGLTKGTTAYNNAALKDIFLNDTPILNSSASNTNPQTSDFNFQNVGFTPRFGTSSQEHITGIESSQSLTSVGVTVTASSPVTRQITNTNVDAAKVTITFPQLQKATDQGDLLGSSVQLKIQVQYNSGGFNDVLSVIPAFDGVAKPSISPSERRSKIVANCLLFKVSGALVGDGGEGGGPPEPLIILSVMLLPD